MKSNLPKESVINKIYEIRGQQVMLDQDLAQLYGVETRVLNQGVKRNPLRFPNDFMFKLSDDEWQNLKSQNVTLRWGGRRKAPIVFTEQGVAMLSGVLKSDRAALVNVQIMRAYSKMRKLILTIQQLYIKFGDRITLDINDSTSDRTNNNG